MARLVVRVFDEIYPVDLSGEMVSMHRDVIDRCMMESGGMVLEIPRAMDYEELENLCTFLRTGSCAALQNGGTFERKRMQVVAELIGSTRLATLAGLRGEGHATRKKQKT